jgi:drug/metabolite transporter superfamily protein YnfA
VKIGASVGVFALVAVAEIDGSWLAGHGLREHRG